MSGLLPSKSVLVNVAWTLAALAVVYRVDAARKAVTGV